ncbi:MAG: LysE family transporter [Trebonia sp.]
MRDWRGARSSPGGHEGPERGPEPGFRTGLLSHVLNPKVGLFFLTVRPRLIPHHAHIAAYALAFAATDVPIAGAWLTTVAWISDKARALLRRPRTRTALDRAAGATLFALGVKVAAGQLA